MRKITYKKLSIQNFLSIGNDVVEINYQNGLNLITGINRDFPDRRNALGKSATINAHFFALYGETLKKLKRDFIVNNVTKGKGNVELEFDVETEKSKDTYIIKRQVKPSKVELWKNGEDITLDSIANNKDFISDLVGTNADACKKCDILTMNDKNNPPFMAMKPEDKRKFINDIFSLEVFGRMMKDLKGIITENNKEMSISSTKIDEISNTLETLNKQQVEYLKKVQEREEILEQKRKDIQEKIDETVEKIAKTFIMDVSTIQIEKDKWEDAWRKLDGKIGYINDAISSKETLRKLKVKEIDKFSSVEYGIQCDKCFQEIPHTHVEYLEKMREQYQSELVDIVEDFEKLTSEKLEYLRKKTKVQQKVSEFQNQINEAKVTKQKLEGLEISLKQYRESLNNLKLEELPNPEFEENIIKTEKRKKSEVEKYAKLKEYSDDLETCKFMLGEEGVKSFVIKRLLSMLNASIQQYINDLGLSIRCKFDEYFDEQMTNDKGKEICYWNLSGAEGRTVDLACAWAFKDIKCKISGVSSNLEMNDEVFDGAFDETGFDKLIDIIKKRIDKYGMSVYAISHRNEAMKHFSGEIVTLEMDGGITRRI